MYKYIYIFSAIITKFDEADYNVIFPDFEEIITCGEDLVEAYTMAKDDLKLCLFDIYEENESINFSTKLENIRYLHLLIIFLIFNLSNYYHTIFILNKHLIKIYKSLYVSSKCY